MAKRKRLKPPVFTRFPNGPDGDTLLPDEDAPLETKANSPFGVAPGAVSRPPIAQVAGDTAVRAALEELASEVEGARSNGRLVQDIALDDIRADHLYRDRMVHEADTEDMDALKASLLARGQQTPIEVVALEGDAYGLISGWRRMMALGALHAETGEARFAKVQALVKPIDSVSDSYIAMVEENEIRSDLSFYERARLACEAANLGVYPTPERAVKLLFAHGSYAKRSKIKSFLRIHQMLGSALRFPSAIPERLGLALSTALEADPAFGARLRDNLRSNPAADASAERALLDRAVKTGAKEGAPAPSEKRSGSQPISVPKSSPAPAQTGAEIVPGIVMTETGDTLILSGDQVGPALRDALTEWLKIWG